MRTTRRKASPRARSASICASSGAHLGAVEPARERQARARRAAGDIDPRQLAAEDRRLARAGPHGDELRLGEQQGLGALGAGAEGLDAGAQVALLAQSRQSGRAHG